MQSVADAAQEIVLVEGFCKIAEDARVKRAGAIIVAGVGGDEYRGNCIALNPEILMQIKITHVRHIDVRDKAGGAAQYPPTARIRLPTKIPRRQIRSLASIP